MNESQKRAANNDLMDPDWKPDFPKVDDFLSRLRGLLNIVKSISESYSNIPDEELSKEGYTLAVRISTTKALEIRKLVKEFT